MYKILFNPVNLELGIIPIRTNKIFKNRILILNNPGKELNVRSTEQIIFSLKKLTIGHIWIIFFSIQLDPFEADLFKLIKKIRFRKYHNYFQIKLKKDTKELKNSKYIWVRADKLKKIYKINPSNYHKILKNEITDTYKINCNDTNSEM